MAAYEIIEARMAAKYKAKRTTRKAVGDFMLSDTHAVNVKSNNLEKQNYSPNITSIKQMHKWVYEKRNDLSFIFVDYKMHGGKPRISKEWPLVPIEQISWKCLVIRAQGYGVIQKVGPLKLIKRQRKSGFYKGFLKAYKEYLKKEKRKHAAFAKKLIADPDSIDW